MKAPSWQPLAQSESVIEENWLFKLRRVGHRSRQSGREHDFYVMDLADAVTVIALTPDNRVILVRQFRAGSGRDGLEPPGGLIDAGEDADQAAARELLEETGYAGETPLVLGTCYANPSILTQRITTVLIKNARLVAPPAPDDHEEVEVLEVPASVIPWMLREGRIHHALAVQGLLLWLASQIPGTPWELPESALRKRWQFNIKALLYLIMICALFCGAVRFLGRAGTLVAAVILIPSGLAWLSYKVDERRNAILLRGLRHTREVLLIRTFAVVGMTVFCGLLALVAVYLVNLFP